MSEPVYIVAAKRTPIGSFCGALKTVPAAELAAVAIRGALAQAGLAPEQVNEVIVGNVVAAGQGMGIGRQAALAAGIPAGVPAYTLNMVCGSGMKTLMDACAHIKAGDAEVVVAAGCENMSQIPFVVKGDLRGGNKMGDMTLSDLLINDGLTDVFNQYHMGVTAENVVAQENISRAEQDTLAAASQGSTLARWSSSVTTTSSPGCQPRASARARWKVRVVMLAPKAISSAPALRKWASAWRESAMIRSVSTLVGYSQQVLALWW